jgi:hypothetical protein
VTPPYALLITALASTRPHLDEGRELVQSMRFRDAEVALQLARTQGESTPARRRELYELLARTLAALGKLQDVEAVYTELLEQDPHAPPPEGVAPKIAGAFERVKSRLFPAGWVAPEEVSLALGTADQPRLSGSALPVPVFATAEQIAPAAVDTQPRWLAWTLAGLSAAAACTGAIFAVSSARDSATARSQHFASDARALDARARQKAIQANFLIGGAAAGGAGAALLLWHWD